MLGLARLTPRRRPVLPSCRHRLRHRSGCAGRRADPAPPSLARAGLAGLLATLMMDVGARTTVAPMLGVAAGGPKDLGRWVGHMPTGRFVHDDIATAAPVRHEAAIGIVAHYTIGITLGEVYGLLLRARCRRRGSCGLALAYGSATTVFSWFVLFPATGQGCSAAGPLGSARSRCSTTSSTAWGSAQRRPHDLDESNGERQRRRDGCRRTGPDLGWSEQRRNERALSVVHALELVVVLEAVLIACHGQHEAC
jgi:Protein of unknown function (DUF2938)